MAVNAERGLVALGGGDRQLAVVDASGVLLALVEIGWPTAVPVAFSPDGQTLAFGTSSHVHILDLTDPGRPERRECLAYGGRKTIAVGMGNRLALARYGEEGSTLVHLPSTRSVWLPSRGRQVSALLLRDDALYVGTQDGEAWRVPFRGTLSWMAR